MTLHTGRYHALALAALLLMFMSCEGDESSRSLPVNGKGKVMLSLHSGVEIEIRSDAAPVSDYGQYNFRYVGVDGYATSQYYRYGDVSWPMEWYFGVFRLQAESCTYEEAETLRGRLRYEGISEPFAVINDQVATASVTCTVANFQVKANFDDTMYEAFDDYRLTVMSVSAPPADDGGEEEEEDVFVPQIYRTLDFTPFDLSGYYNLQSGPVNLKYELHVMPEDAEEMILVKEGYFSIDDQVTPAVPAAGDIVTFNVGYTGKVDVSDGIKFIVNGSKQTMDNALGLEDYVQGNVEEDR